MKLQRPGSTERDWRLPMTSLIDVVFLLLIYFMLTLSFSVRETDLGAALQSEQRGGAAADLQPQVVHVELLDGRTVFRVGEQVFTTREDLTRLLERLPKERGVFVRVSNLPPVSAAAAALQACKDAGFRRVTYVPSSRG
ncbi:MAG: biopolymer transporter ExbD [Phycisphaeraceae bacterium]|nr:biopolymer transporter ExbD [Phycisphaeraceae bacterium]MCW5753586.1 biopolymer transporter ExbD [Phycisphaeraceae bacterium]